VECSCDSLREGLNVVVVVVVVVLVNAELRRRLPLMIQND
jgi:hypothetical protein